MIYLRKRKDTNMNYVKSQLFNYQKNTKEKVL